MKKYVIEEKILKIMKNICKYYGENDNIILEYIANNN